MLVQDFLQRSTVSRDAIEQFLEDNDCELVLGHVVKKKVVSEIGKSEVAIQIVDLIALKARKNNLFYYDHNN